MLLDLFSQPSRLLSWQETESTSWAFWSWEEGIFGWIGQGIDYSSRFLFPYRYEIYCAAVASSAAAIVAALVGAIACMVFCTLSAAICFGIALWAFRMREAKLSADLGTANHKFLRSIKEGDKNLAREKKCAADLRKKLDQLESLEDSRRKQIADLQETNKERSEEIQHLVGIRDELQSQLDRLLKVADIFEYYV